MIRAILLIILLMVIYHAVKTVLRSAINAYYYNDNMQTPKRISGEEMVRDPQCLTYVVKSRSLARRVAGKTEHFCSAACADEYERAHRA